MGDGVLETVLDGDESLEQTVLLDQDSSWTESRQDGE